MITALLCGIVTGAAITYYYCQDKHKRETASMRQRLEGYRMKEQQATDLYITPTGLHYIPFSDYNSL